MKHTQKMYLLQAAALFCAVASMPAHAQTPVNIIGSVVAFSCTASVNGGTNTVTLPQVSATAFPNVTNRTGLTPFTVDAVGCGAGTGPVKAYFYSNHVTNGRLDITTGPGAGWQYELLTGNDNIITVTNNATPSNNASDPGGTIRGGGASIGYKVQYFRSATAITQGSASTSVNLALFYP